MANQEERNRQMQQIIAKCWSDEAFKEKLVADPHTTLAGEGVEIPEGVNINVHSNTADTFHLVIPAMPEDVELSDKELDEVIKILNQAKTHKKRIAQHHQTEYFFN